MELRGKCPDSRIGARADFGPYGEFPIRAIIACPSGTKAWTGFSGFLGDQILVALDILVRPWALVNAEAHTKTRADGQECPMPLGCDPPHPGGMADNSPYGEFLIRALKFGHSADLRRANPEGIASLAGSHPTRRGSPSPTRARHYRAHRPKPISIQPVHKSPRPVANHSVRQRPTDPLLPASRRGNSGDMN